MGWVLCHCELYIWSYNHLKYREKSAEKYYFCWECCKQGLKRNKFVIMGIEP